VSSFRRASSFRFFRLVRVRLRYGTGKEERGGGKFLKKGGEGERQTGYKGTSTLFSVGVYCNSPPLATMPGNRFISTVAHVSKRKRIIDLKKKSGDCSLYWHLRLHESGGDTPITKSLAQLGNIYPRPQGEGGRGGKKRKKKRKGHARSNLLSSRPGAGPTGMHSAQASLVCT